MAFAYEVVPRDSPSEMCRYLNLVKLDGAARTLRGDMSWVARVDLARTLEEAEDCARRYWSRSATEEPEWEVLVEGSLVVIGPVPSRVLPHARPRNRARIRQVEGERRPQGGLGGSHALRDGG